MSKAIGPDYFEIQSKLNAIRFGKIKEKEYQAYNALGDLLEIDTVNRIISLNDFNTDNFGFLIKKEENNYFGRRRFCRKMVVQSS